MITEIYKGGMWDAYNAPDSEDFRMRERRDANIAKATAGAMAELGLYGFQT